MPAAAIATAATPNTITLATIAFLLGRIGSAA
jgi:hypothetical protein